MNRIRFILGLVCLAASAVALHSCNDNNYYYPYLRPTALVTVRPVTDDSFVLQLDDYTTLYPSNMKASPFGSKEVRALVNYSIPDAEGRGLTQSVHVNWIDSIRTKQPVPNLGAGNAEKYGNDPIEIMRDWVTVAEDGYLTLRIRTRWGNSCTPHIINLVSDVNAGNPYEFELRHDAQGDIYGQMGDALVAFNLNDLPRDEGDNVRIKVRWISFSGEKSVEFPLRLRPAEPGKDEDDLTDATYSKYVE